MTAPTQATAREAVELPPLPRTWHSYTAEQVRAYALSALAAKQEEVDKMRAESKKLLVVLKEGRRAIGDHHAPDDCYATGPMTGDPIRDLVECPACSFIGMFDSLIARAALSPSQQGEPK